MSLRSTSPIAGWTASWDMLLRSLPQGRSSGRNRCQGAEGPGRKGHLDYLGSDVDFPPDMAEAFWLADTRSSGELKAFLDWRCTVVASLVAEIRSEVRKDATVAVIPSVARPTGGAWYEGSDLQALAGAAGIIEACFYEPSPSAHQGRPVSTTSVGSMAEASSGASQGRHGPIFPARGFPRRDRDPCKGWRKRPGLLQRGHISARRTSRGLPMP